MPTARMAATLTRPIHEMAATSSMGSQPQSAKSQKRAARKDVKAPVVSQGRGDKVTIFKMRRRKHYQKHQGHRQSYTELKIDSIVG